MQLKTRIFLIVSFVGLLLAAVILAPAQTIDSTVHISTFPGSTVAQKLTNAMPNCTMAPTVHCYLVIDPSLKAAADGGVSGVTLCAGCILLDYRNGFPAAAGSAGSGACPAGPPQQFEIGDTAAGPSCAQVPYSAVSGAPAQTTVNGIAPAVTVQSDPSDTDGHIVVGTASPNINLKPHDLDQLDTTNTHRTGNQLYLTGGAANPAVVEAGTGTNTANVVNSGNTVSSQVITPTVAVGQFLVVWAYSNGGCCSVSPVSTLGNTFSELGGSDSCFSAICTGIWTSKITVAGGDSINTHMSQGLWALLSGINLTTPFDPTTAQNPLGNVAAPGSLNHSINQGGANDLILSFSNIASGTLTPSNCDMNLATGFTSVLNFVGDGSRTLRIQDLTSITLGTTAYPVNSTCNAGSGNLAGTIVALQISGTYTQTAPLHEYKDNAGNVLSDTDAQGAYNPPQSAGFPATTPAPGTHAYNTTAHCDGMYDAINGWGCMLSQFSSLFTDTTASSYMQLGPFWVQWGTASPTATNTNQDFTLPHAFPNACLKVVAADNGARVTGVGGTVGNPSPGGCDCKDASHITCTSQATNNGGSGAEPLGYIVVGR